MPGLCLALPLRRHHAKGRIGLEIQSTSAAKKGQWKATAGGCNL